MNRLLTTAVIAVCLGSAANAAEETIEAESLQGLQQVDSFTALAGLHSWTALDEDTLIVWSTPFRPYLLELRHPSNELKFAHAIGVTQFGSRVHARFDSVKVRGFVYPIDEIYKLSRDEAKQIAKTF